MHHQPMLLHQQRYLPSDLSSTSSESEQHDGAGDVSELHPHEYHDDESTADVDDDDDEVDSKMYIFYVDYL